jgi:hypothetical protein
MFQEKEDVMWVFAEGPKKVPAGKAGQKVKALVKAQ